MNISETRARITARIWEGVAQSGVDLSVLDKEQSDKLVGAISDAVLGELDILLGEAAPAPSEAVTAALTPSPAPEEGSAVGTDPVPDDGIDERVLWEGRPFLSIRVHYQITTERVRIVEGIVGKEREDIELVRVQDIDQRQSVGERIAGIGDIFIRSHDPSSPAVVLRNVREPLEVHEILRRAVLNARRRHNLTYREEM